MVISESVVQSIVSWIDENVHLPLHIDELARRSGYSKWHFQRIFKQVTGVSVGKYISERKLNLAARDLRETTQRICDISLKYGYDSQQEFTRRFDVVFNLSPGEYRRNNRKASPYIG